MYLQKCKANLLRERLIAVFLVMSLSVLCNAQFAGGRGTQDNPWLIETANQLNNIRNYIGSEHGDKYFRLTADIDLGVAPYNQGEGWLPVGIDQPFFGQFDGSGFSIGNMVINRNENYQGFFSQLQGSTVKNIRFDNGSVSGYNFTGGITGRAFNSSINNSSFTGEINGRSTVGGIVGNASATPVRECFTTGIVRGTSTVGGIAGSSSVITDSYSTMTVITRSGYIGGLAGRTSGTITRCYYTGNIISLDDNEFMGGLVGFVGNAESINSFWNIQTTGITETDCGGTGLEISDMVLTETYQQGEPEEHWDFTDIWDIVEGETYPFFSRQQNPMNENVPGPFNLSVEEDAENLEIALSWDMLGEPSRFIIYRYGSPIAQVDYPINTYADLNVAPVRDYTYYVTALFVDNGEELETLPSNYVKAYLTSDFTGGEGTILNPYQVNSPATLSLVRNNLTAHYIQTADINLGISPWNEGEGWEPIGYDQINSFQGSYNGNGFIIRGLMVNCDRGINRGLFGRTFNSTLKNIGIVDVNIVANGNSGGLVAFADTGTEIERCFVSGRVTSSGYTGGIVGQFRPGGRLVDCYSNVAVNTVSSFSSHYAGGLAGYSSNVEILRNYAVGSVQTRYPTIHAGALIGWRSGVNAEVAGNYWNVETAYQETAGRGMENVPGSTSLQMVQAITFAGFDFEAVWRMDEDASYPYLRWQGEEPSQFNIPHIPAMNVTASGGEDGIINLSWEAPHNNVGIPDGYNIYRNNERINQMPVTELAYRDTGLTNWKKYTYTVTAIYGDIESFPSKPVQCPAYYYAGGSGTEQDPYLVENAWQLYGIRFFLNSHYLQIADIDLDESPWIDGSGWERIGDTYENCFRGSLNGSGYVITNLLINRREEDNVGLFGYSASAHFSNIGLKDVHIIGKSSVVALVSEARENTIIEQSYVSGIIKGDRVVAGFVGRLNTSCRVSDCYSVATIEVYRTVAAGQYAGGIVGFRMGGDVVRNYSTGSILAVENSTFVGAVLGRSGTGAGSVNNNYWNTETSRQTTGGVDDMPGSTTVEMLSQETYQGFNFNNVWRIEEGESYPYFSWEGDEPGNHNRPNLPPPANLSAIGGDRVVNLSWDAPTLILPGFIGYNIFRDNNRINDQPVDETQFEDTDLTNWQSYRYHLIAVYEIGESAQSVPADAITYAFAGGSGTTEEPYLIETADQLNGVRLFVTSHFRQIADIDLDIEPYNEGEGWEPIGVNPDVFRASYDGGNYIISGLTINRPQGFGQALFANSYGAHLKNVGLVGVNIVGGNFVAALVADVQAPGAVIENCFVTGSITGVNNVAGIVAQMRGTPLNLITNCYSTAMITANNPRGPAVAGGIIGYLQRGIVRKNYSVGPVYSSFPSERTGAVIGRCDDNVEVSQNYWNSETTAQPTGGFNVGDMPGHTTHQLLRAGTFTGFDYDTIWNIDEGNSYPYLQWEGEEPGAHNIPHSFPPRNLTGIPLDGNVALRWEAPPDEFPAPEGYNVYRNNELINDELVVLLEYQDTDVQTWQYYNYYVTAVYEETESVPGNMVRVLVHSFPDGTGEEDDPFLVETAEHLNGVRFLKASHFRQIADIDLLEYDSWTPIGSINTDPFQGVYDGDGFAILNLRISQNVSASLFGAIDGAILSNVVIPDADFTNVASQSGLLAGDVRNSTITDCRVTGSLATSVGGVSSVGGFVARTDSDTEIRNSSSNVEILVSGGTSGGFVGFDNGNIVNCISLGSISSTAETATFIGGFVGRQSHGSIVNSYSRSFVTAQQVNNTTTRIGGFAGYNHARITNCYATGRISAGRNYVGGLIGFNGGTVANSYWDTNTYGYTESAGGDGRTTDQMTYEYDEETYVDWDFEEIWVEDTDASINDGYPYLFHYADMSSPNPRVAINPVPLNGFEEVPIDLSEVTWEYSSSVLYTDPAGFRVYFNSTGEFDENDDFEWVIYDEEEDNFSAENILPELNYATTYYWRVVPTTIEPEERRGLQNEPVELFREVQNAQLGTISGYRRKNRNDYERNSGTNTHYFRGDAQNCPIWSFTTESSPYPANATNPSPADEAVDVSLTPGALSWHYIEVETHVNPVGFRIYLNTTGEFSDNDDYEWVDYIEEEELYDCEDILPEMLESSTTYYWKVVPTNIERTALNCGRLPQESGFSTGVKASNDAYRLRTSKTEQVGSQTRFNGRQGSALLLRGDAHNNPVWSFTTIDVAATDENHSIPYITALQENYPNPFNPETTISFSLAAAGSVSIDVFDIRGRRISRLVDEEMMDAGSHLIVWNGKDEAGKPVASGVYFYRMRSGDFSTVRKMLMLK